LIFLSNALGFIVSSFLSNKLHIVLGQCKSLILGAALQMLCYVILSTHPPFALVVIGFFFAGAGMGFLLAHCNSYMVSLIAIRLMKATRPKAVRVLGYMHSCYGTYLR
jgi:MFS family permease